MRGNLSNEIVSIKIEEGSKRPIALHEKSKFGKIEADSLHLSLIEACYLLEKYADATVLSDTITYDNIDKTPKVASVSLSKINTLSYTLRCPPVSPSYSE